MPATTSKTTETIAAHAVQSALGVYGDGGYLELAVQVQSYTNYQSLRRLEVDIKLKFGKERKKNIGYIVGFLVDKSNRCWIDELLYQDNRGDDDLTAELRTIIREVYCKTDKPRAKVSHFAGLVSHEKLLFTDIICLKEGYRSQGVAKAVLPMFHNLVGQLASPATPNTQPRAIALLSPAKSSAVERNNGKDEIEAERGLIRAYMQGSDYHVLIHGPEDKPGSITVMGRLI